MFGISDRKGSGDDEERTLVSGLVHRPLRFATALNVFCARRSLTSERSTAGMRTQVRASSWRRTSAASSVAVKLASEISSKRSPAISPWKEVLMDPGVAARTLGAVRAVFVMLGEGAHLLVGDDSTLNRCLATDCDAIAVDIAPFEDELGRNENCLGVEKAHQQSQMAGESSDKSRTRVILRTCFALLILVSFARD